MELISVYLEAQLPSVVSIKPHESGYQKGTISDGASTLSFYYSNLKYDLRRREEPVYTQGSGMVRSFTRGRRELEITMEILLDNNETYTFFHDSRDVLQLETELFRTQAVMFAFGPHVEVYDEMKAVVKFYSIGDFTLLPKEPIAVL